MEGTQINFSGSFPTQCSSYWSIIFLVPTSIKIGWIVWNYFIQLHQVDDREEFLDFYKMVICLKEHLIEYCNTQIISYEFHKTLKMLLFLIKKLNKTQIIFAIIKHFDFAFILPTLF